MVKEREGQSPDETLKTSNRSPEGSHLLPGEPIGRPARTFSHSFIHQADQTLIWFNNKSLPSAFPPLFKTLLPSGTPVGLHRNAWRQLEQVGTIHFVNKELETQRGDETCQRAHNSQGHGGKQTRVPFTTLTPFHWPHDIKHSTNPESLILTAHFASQQTNLN